jgi:inhibitor of KinA
MEIRIFEKVANYVKSLSTKTSETAPPSNRITIPVCYGNDFGPDIEFVSRQSDLSPAELIKIHSVATYMVHMIGFVPGFAYMGGMDKRLATPRKSIPRSSVDTGSVGIAGEQTGIYSLNTPGGWQIIGRTPLRLFDPEREQASLLKAGDEVIFEPITIKEFNALSLRYAY